MAKNPDLVMVVYDCTNVQSLKNGLKWLDKVKKLNNKSSLAGVLVSSKSEHKTAKEVSAEEGQKYAQKLGLQYFQVSAVTQLLNIGIQYRSGSAIPSTGSASTETKFDFNLMNLYALNICKLIPFMFLFISNIDQIICM